MFKGVHDSEIVAYSVDSRTEELVLTLAPGTGSARQEFIILFRGVAAHQFEYPLIPSIVLDLVEIPAAELSRECGRNWLRGIINVAGRALGNVSRSGCELLQLESAKGVRARPVLWHVGLGVGPIG